LCTRLTAFAVLSLAARWNWITGSFASDWRFRIVKRQLVLKHKF
jgi:hypothetical protein